MRDTDCDAYSHSNSYAYTDSYAYGHSDRHALSDAYVPTGRTDNNTLRLE